MADTPADGTALRVSLCACFEFDVAKLAVAIDFVCETKRKAA
jgi:hypothetical protein